MSTIVDLAPSGGVNAGANGMGKQIEEVLALSQFHQHVAADAMFKEEPGVEIALEGCQKGVVSIYGLVEISFARQFFLPGKAFLADGEY